MFWHIWKFLVKVTCTGNFRKKTWHKSCGLKVAYLHERCCIVNVNVISCKCCKVKFTKFNFTTTTTMFLWFYCRLKPTMYLKVFSLVTFRYAVGLKSVEDGREWWLWWRRARESVRCSVAVVQVPPVAGRVSGRYRDGGLCREVLASVPRSAVPSSRWVSRQLSIGPLSRLADNFMAGLAQIPA